MARGKTKQELEREVAELRRLAFDVIEAGRSAEAETHTRSTEDGKYPYAYGMLESAVRRMAVMLNQPFPEFSVEPIGPRLVNQFFSSPDDVNRVVNLAPDEKGVQS
jgi:hypothetical protein